jgi:hypothetical protein
MPVPERQARPGRAAAGRGARRASLVIGLALSGAVAAERGLITGDAADSFRDAAVESLLGTNGFTGGGVNLGGSTIFGFVINAGCVKITVLLLVPTTFNALIEAFLSN